MDIDCATCPGRPRACDGCVMTILLPPSTALSSDDSSRKPSGPAAGEVDAIRAAVDTFVSCGLAGPAARRSPIVIDGGARAREQHRRRAG